MAKNKQAQRTRREERARAAMQHRPAQRRTNLWLAVAAVVLVVAGIGGMVAVRSLVGSSTNSAGTPRTGVPPAVMKAVTSVPGSAFDTAGIRAVGLFPTRIKGAVPKVDGKPVVMYFGAEYCPFCAAERWAVVVGLSRFGRFQNLGVTHSASVIEFPDTPTFSFHGATYTSRYISFQGVETHTNKVVNGSFTPLDVPTPLEDELFSRYDRPPFFPKADAIPFIDFGNRYAMAGTSFSPALLQGLTVPQIAAVLGDPTTPIGESILGSANVVSAAVCSITGQQPAAVCSSSGVAAAAKKLGG